MCLRGSHSENKLKDHKTYCGEDKAAKISLSKLDENILVFKHYNRCLNIPFVIDADFECVPEHFKLVNHLMKHLMLMPINNMYKIISHIISNTVTKTLNHQSNIVDQMLLKCSIK